MSSFKRGFTLVELLAVISIAAILILIAVPNFSGSTEKAKLSLIKNDIKVAEGELAKKDFEKGYFDSLESFVVSDNSEVYDKRGVYNEIGDTSLRDITGIIESTLNDKGYFLADKDKKVYYVSNTQEGEDGAPIKPEPKPEPEEIEYTDAAPESDFVWVEDRHGYKFPTEKEKGYWHYIGKEKEVKIPLRIKGEKLFDYYSMFRGTEVEKVYSNNRDIVSLDSMFFNSRAKVIDVSEIYAKNVKIANLMFADSKAHKEEIIFGGFDSSNIEEMTAIFRSLKADKLDLSHLNTKSLKRLTRAFHMASINEVNLDNFNTSNVTDMRGMFNASSGFKGVSLKSFNTSKVTDMSEMFNQVNWSHYDLDLSHFDTSNVTDMSGMFDTTRVKSLNINNFDTSNVRDMSYMFRQYEDNAKTLDLNHFDTSKVTNMRDMFHSATVKELKISKFDTSNVKDMSNMFRYFSVPDKKIDLSNFDTSNVTDMNQMFSYACFITEYKSTHSECKYTDLDISNFDIKESTSIESMFRKSFLDPVKVKSEKIAERVKEEGGKNFNDLDIKVKY